MSACRIHGIILLYAIIPEVQPHTLQPYYMHPPMQEKRRFHKEKQQENFAEKEKSITFAYKYRIKQTKTRIR